MEASLPGRRHCSLEANLACDCHCPMEASLPGRRHCSLEATPDVKTQRPDLSHQMNRVWLVTLADQAHGSRKLAWEVMIFHPSGSFRKIIVSVQYEFFVFLLNVYQLNAR